MWCSPRAEEGRELLQVKQIVEEEKYVLYDYVKKSQELWLKEVNEGKLLKNNKSNKDWM